LALTLTLSQWERGRWADSPRPVGEGPGVRAIYKGEKKMMMIDFLSDDLVKRET
jgi:hypothetical protein